MTENSSVTSSLSTEWRPPAGFVPVPSGVPGVEVYAPAPQETGPERRTFKCPKCGASTAYSAADAALACAHCGYVETPDAPVVGRRAAEAEFTVDTMERAARGWGRTRREIHCESCGANISLEPKELATTCPFCASHRVVARDETHTAMLRPSYLIPFQIDREAGVRVLRDWLARGWMHPPELRRVARAARLNGVYLPYWTFDARLDTAWQAEVGHKRTRRTWDGKRKTEIKWEWKSGRLNVLVDDMLMPGSSKVSPVLLNRLNPFELTALTVYDPAYLAGWQAHAYDVGLRPAWDRARNWMRERAKGAVRRDINSRYVRNLGVNVDMADESWRYVLLPVYLVAYRYGDKVYQVLVNGQTGQVAGQKPVAWRRVLGALVLLLLPALLLGALSGWLPEGLGGISLMLSFGALVVGLAMATRVLREAFAADDA